MTTRRRVPLVAVGLALAAVLASPGVAVADVPAPGNPYMWFCGGSRAGGLRVAAAAEEITVVVTPQGGEEFTQTFTGNVKVDVEGGGSGKAVMFVSNDGFISPDTRTFCSGSP